MTLSLLQICARALDEISSFNVPNFIVGNSSDDTARTLLASAFKVGEELVRDFDWQELSKTGTVTTVVDTSLYALESDYDRVAPDTMWDATQARAMFGNTTRRRWAAITNSVAYAGISYIWRLKGNRIQLFPAASSVFSFNYEYLSNIYCTDSLGVDRADGWIADTDLPKLPADIFIHGIRYYFADAKNLTKAPTWQAEYYGVLDSRQEKNIPAEAIDMSAGTCAPGRKQRYLNIKDHVDFE